MKEGLLSRFDALRTTIGRDEQCRVRLEDTETSRLHAEVILGDQGPVIRDLASTNGIRVNGTRVEQSLLSPGKVVRIGGWVGVCVDARGDDDAAAPMFQEVVAGVFAGPVLRATLELARRVAQSDLPVVLEGETGTGKERVAQAIHAWSGRGGPFIAINCAALPESIAEAELFGYRRGAFTGAERSSPGHFRAAHGGTLLLDEISDLPLALQAKVLRVIEEREVVPLGESRAVPIDIRLIAAGQTSLLASVQASKFRADLFARLEGETIHLPPLRERREDVPYLFQQLLSRHGQGKSPHLDPQLVEQLCIYHWPFNVRELDLLARRMIARHGDAVVLSCEHVPERFLQQASPPAMPGPPGPAAPAPGPKCVPDSRPWRAGPVEDELDFAALTEQLRVHRGNLARAATAAGISRQRAYRLLQVHPEIDLGAMREGRSSSSDDG